MDAQDVIPAEFYLASGDDDTLSITLDRSRASVEDGKTLSLTATATSGATVVFASTDTSVATVNASTGLVTAVDPGVCVITAKATKNGESAIATCNLTVTEAEGEG